MLVLRVRNILEENWGRVSEGEGGGFLGGWSVRGRRSRGLVRMLIGVMGMGNEGRKD